MSDKDLGILQKRITKEYRKAEKQITDKWNKYMKQGEKRLNALRMDFINAPDDLKAEYKKVYSDALKSYTLRNEKYQAMLNETTSRIAEVNQVSLSYINNSVPTIYTRHFNEISKEAKEVGVRFDIVNEDVVKRRIKDGTIRTPYKKLDEIKDKRWNMKAINSSVLQGIIQGESIKDIAKRLYTIVNRNEASAIRNARTLVTATENQGRLDSYERLTENGAVLNKVWIATGDDRVRDLHLSLDGQEVPIDEPFIDDDNNELMYPADPDGAPETTYNCRCSMTTHIVGIKKPDGKIMPLNIKPRSSLHKSEIRAEKRSRRESNGNRKKH